MENVSGGDAWPAFDSLVAANFSGRPIDANASPKTMEAANFPCFGPEQKRKWEGGIFVASGSCCQETNGGRAVMADVERNIKMKEEREK